MRRHPLKGDRSFYARTEHNTSLLVTITLYRGGLPLHAIIMEKEAPDGVATEMLDEGLVREDLTALDFVTIDSASNRRYG